MRPTVQSWMNSGISSDPVPGLDREHASLVRKLVLIELAGNTTITITLLVNSFNRPMHDQHAAEHRGDHPPGTATTTPVATPTPDRDADGPADGDDRARPDGHRPGDHAPAPGPPHPGRGHPDRHAHPLVS